MIEFTLFIPLSGRNYCWPHLSKFLDSQQIKKDRCKLFLLDTSGNMAFGRRVRGWISKCDYPHVAYEQKVFSQRRSLADLDRLTYFEEVNRVMVQIYSYAQTVVEGDVVFIVEDDIVPPVDAYKRLLPALKEDVFSVSACYQIRNTDRWVAWEDINETVSNMRGTGLQAVQGTGFGCIVLWREDFCGTEFTWTSRPTKDPNWPWGYDMEFFSKQKKKILMNWDVYCDHLADNGENKCLAILG